jgi:isopenicillin N synthase-like dioxygenase
VDPESRGDVHEAFDFGVPCTSIYAPNFERTDKDVNVWPTQLGEPFKNSIMNYYYAVTGLGRKLLQIFALSLNLDETYFDKYVTLPAVIARVLYYPPQTGEVDMKELGIGAHRYIGCICLILIIQRLRTVHYSCPRRRYLCTSGQKSGW